MTNGMKLALIIFGAACYAAGIFTLIASQDNRDRAARSSPVESSAKSYDVTYEANGWEIRRSPTDDRGVSCYWWGGRPDSMQCVKTQGAQQ